MCLFTTLFQACTIISVMAVAFSTISCSISCSTQYPSALFTIIVLSHSFWALLQNKLVCCSQHSSWYNYYRYRNILSIQTRKMFHLLSFCLIRKYCCKSLFWALLQSKLVCLFPAFFQACLIITDMVKVVLSKVGHLAHVPQ